MCIVTSKTSRAPATIVDDERPTIKGTHRELQRNQQTSPAHAIAEKDDERGLKWGA